MINKKNIILVSTLVFIAIIGFCFNLNRNKSSLDTRGGQFNNAIEITYNNDSEYKDMKINIDTKIHSDEEIPLKITLKNPKDEEKILNTMINKKAVANFTGDKGHWKIKFETGKDIDVDYLVNFEGKNK